MVKINVDATFNPTTGEGAAVAIIREARGGFAAS
jgi:hypothetical protein